MRRARGGEKGKRKRSFETSYKAASLSSINASSLSDLGPAILILLTSSLLIRGSIANTTAPKAGKEKYSLSKKDRLESHVSQEEREECALTANVSALYETTDIKMRSIVLRKCLGF